MHRVIRKRQRAIAAENEELDRREAVSFLNERNEDPENSKNCVTTHLGMNQGRSVCKRSRVWKGLMIDMLMYLNISLFLDAPHCRKSARWWSDVP